MKLNNRELLRKCYPHVLAFPFANIMANNGGTSQFRTALFTADNKVFVTIPK